MDLFKSDHAVDVAEEREVLLKPKVGRKGALHRMLYSSAAIVSEQGHLAHFDYQIVAVDYVVQLLVVFSMSQLQHRQACATVTGFRSQPINQQSSKISFECTPTLSHDSGRADACLAKRQVT